MTLMTHLRGKCSKFFFGYIELAPMSVKKYRIFLENSVFDKNSQARKIPNLKCSPEAWKIQNNLVQTAMRCGHPTKSRGPARECEARHRAEGYFKYRDDIAFRRLNSWFKLGRSKIQIVQVVSLLHAEAVTSRYATARSRVQINPFRGQFLTWCG